MKIKRSTYCNVCPKIFSERLKRNLCHRIDKFIKETSKNAKSDKEWVKSYLLWSKPKYSNFKVQDNDMSNIIEKDKIIEEILSDCKTLAQKKKRCEIFNIPFKWPNIGEQISGQGKCKRIKRGRAIHERVMFVIPGFEIPGHTPFPGFVCHPDAALYAASELLRLYKEQNK